MRSIFVCFAFLTVFVGIAQNPFPIEEIQYSPGGKFDKVFDHYGNEYRLKDLKIDTVTPTNKSISFPSECNSGYFKLYFENGSGFEIQNDAVHQQRRAVLCQLFYDLSQFIIPVNPNVSVNILVKKFDSMTISNQVGAYASSVYLTPALATPNSGGIIDNAIWQVINSGNDPFNNFSLPLNATQSSIGFYHGILSFNLSDPTSWHQNLTTCPSNLKDMYTIGLHEIVHALGFASLINENGLSKFGANYPYFSRYDLFLETSDGTNLLTNTGACGSLYDYTFNSPLLNTSSLFVDNPICQIKFGGIVNQIVYDTPPFSNGSSLSHFEDLCHSPNAYPDNSYYVMANGTFIPNTNPAQFYSNRYLKEEERKVFCELGYHVNNSYGSSVAENFHIYLSPYTCGGDQVVGINDGIGPFLEYTNLINEGDPLIFNYPDFLQNDYSIQGNIVTYECPQSVYGLGTITEINSTSFEYLANNGVSGVDLIRYIPVSSTGEKGNITYIYLYITNGSCLPSACNNYVNNGDFEISYGCSNLEGNVTSSCWNSFMATPDLFTTNHSECNIQLCKIPTSHYSNPPTNTWNETTDNNYFIGMIGLGSVVEGVQNKLIAPLIPDVNYLLRFRAKIGNNTNFVGVSNLLFAGSSFPSVSSTQQLTSTPLFLRSLHVESISNFDWEQFEIPFFFTGGNAINYLTLINASYIPNSGHSYVFIDDIEIVETNSAITFNSISTNCLNQVVDLNNCVNLAGGTFSGTGVIGSTFYPNIAGVGTHELTYTFYHNINCSTNITSKFIVHDVNTAPQIISEQCTGESVILTVENEFNNFIWSTGETSQSISVSPLITTTYSVSAVNGCGTVLSSSITIDPQFFYLPPQILIVNSSSPPICAGTTVTLSVFNNFDSTTSQYLWSNGSTTSTINVNPVINTSYYVTITNANGCQISTVSMVYIDPIASIQAFNGITSLCQNGSVFLIGSNNGGQGLTYQWQLDGVDIIGATSLNFNAITTGSYSLVVTRNGCSSTSNTIIVTQNNTPTFTQLPSYCVGQTPANLPLSSHNGITGTWNPSIISTSISGSNIYTFTPTASQCVNATTMTIVVNPPNITPNFTQLPNFCVGQNPTSLPSFSTNNIIGEWSPQIISTNTPGTTTYTFTPTAGQCATTTTMTITVNPSITPTFTQVPPICLGGTLNPLPTTSTNGISGTWSPALNNTATTTYTFTPTAGQCATTTTMTITVNPNITPTFTQVPPICSGGTLNPLPTTSTNGKTGTWSPALNNTATTTYTFTPTAGQCATTTTMTITVNPLPAVPTISVTETSGLSNNDGIICSGASVTLTTSGGTSYSWSNGQTTASITVSPTSSTTYTVSITNANGCQRSNSRTITVNPLPAVPTINATETSGLSNNDGTICTGASVTLATSGGTSYSWSNGQTTASITVSPTSSTTYTVSITNANGCQRSNFRTITVNPLPVFSINNSNPVICSGTAVTLSPNPSAGLYNFSWSPGGQTAASITVNPSTTTNYTLSARSTTTGCYNTASTTITVNSVSNTACCSAANYTFNSPVNSSAMGTIPSGSTVQVNADITVNANRTFTNCTLRMAPNVKITVNSGVTLTLTNCKVFSCSEMWDGIYSNPGAMVIINSNSVIEDAMNAVKSVGGGNYQLTGSTFNKNNISVYNDLYYDLPHPGTITGCTFDCSTTNTNTSGATLKAPMAGQKSHFGVYSYHANSTVGAINGVPNEFKNLEVGIFAFGQSIKIYKNNFSLIKQPNCYLSPSTCNPDLGWPIWCRRTNVTIGTSSGTTGQNNFTDCTSGIRIQEGCPFQIFYNNFSTINSPGLQGNSVVSKCIFVDQNYALGNNNAIRFNNFTTFEKGIYYTNSEASSLNISNNTFGNFTVLNDNTINGAAIQLSNNAQGTISISNNVVNNTTQTGTVGIIVQNPTIITGTSLVVQGNTIRNVRNGIWVTNYSSPQILNHEPSYSSVNGNLAGILFPANFVATTPEQSGIHIENCPGATIQNNRIERTNYTSTAPAPLNVNQFNLQFGISVGNNCTGTTVLDNSVRLLGTGIYAFGNTPITLQCNNMVNNATGLWINSLIGNQGTVSAPQDNTWTIPSGYLGVRRAGNTDPLYSPKFFTRSFSLPYMPNPITMMNPTQAIQSISSSISAPYTCFISAGNPPAGLIQVINEEGEYSYLSEEELKTLDIDLYKTLKIIPDYYDENTFEGLRIKEYVDSVGMSNSAKIYEYEEKLTEKDTLGAKELMALFEAYSDVELNYKRVYEIFNRSWLDGVHYFTEEDSLILNEIAYLSPRIAGNAVYTARVLLGLMIIDTETFSAKSAQLNTTNPSSYLRIFPNPSNDYFHYHLPLNDADKGTIIISDICGKEIQKWSADYTTNKGSLDIQNYAKGVYLFELIINGNDKLVQKLIVK